MVEALRSTADPGAGEPGGRRPGRGRRWCTPGPRSKGPSGRSTWPGDRSGITAVERAGDPDGFETEYGLRHGRTLRRVPAMPARMADQVARRLRGERTSGPAVDLGGLTAFEQAVLRKTMEIPYGEVRPYAWVAREIERPRAVRAVGSALAGNPVPFVIPCHRVVRTDGHIGEYGAGGPEAKREVLGVGGRRHGRRWSACRQRHALHGQRHDPHLLLPVLPARATHHAGPRGALPHRPRRRVRRATTPAASAGRWRPRRSRPEARGLPAIGPVRPPCRGHDQRGAQGEGLVRQRCPALHQPLPQP